MENPPKGGERKTGKIVKKAFGWLALQALGVALRHLFEQFF
ncbi:hypothetical protein ACFVOO_32490 [Streptomyces rochei]